MEGLGPIPTVATRGMLSGIPTALTGKSAPKFPMPTGLKVLVERDSDKVREGKASFGEQALKRAFRFTDQMEKDYLTVSPLGVDSEVFVRAFGNPLFSAKTPYATDKIRAEMEKRALKVEDYSTTMMRLSMVTAYVQDYIAYLIKCSWVDVSPEEFAVQQQAMEDVMEVQSFITTLSLRMAFRLKSEMVVERRTRFLDSLDPSTAQSASGKASSKSAIKKLPSFVAEKLKKVPVFGPDLFAGKFEEVFDSAAQHCVLIADSVNALGSRLPSHQQSTGYKRTRQEQAGFPKKRQRTRKSGYQQQPQAAAAQGSSSQGAASSSNPPQRGGYTRGTPHPGRGRGGRGRGAPGGVKQPF